METIVEVVGLLIPGATVLNFFWSFTLSEGKINIVRIGHLYWFKLSLTLQIMGANIFLKVDSRWWGDAYVTSTFETQRARRRRSKLVGSRTHRIPMVGTRGKVSVEAHGDNSWKALRFQKLQEGCFEMDISLPSHFLWRRSPFPGISFRMFLLKNLCVC